MSVDKFKVKFLKKVFFIVMTCWYIGIGLLLLWKDNPVRFDILSNNQLLGLIFLLFVGTVYLSTVGKVFLGDDGED